MTDALKPRLAAIQLLMEVTERGQLLAEVLADPNGPLKDLSGPDRARAQRLALSTLRVAIAADDVLSHHVNRQPHPRVHAILRLAVAELAERPADAYGIVSAAVDLTRADTKTVNAAGFVNAVLRKLSTKMPAMPAQRLPSWMRDPLRRTFGKDALRGIENAHLAGPMLDLTLKDPSKGEEWAEKLGASRLETGSLRLAPGVQVSALAGFETGDWWVQDAAASVPAQVLAIQAGERVLDMCAAPGGKTMQLAAAGGIVTALDSSANRMERVRENLARTGLSAETVVADALTWQTDTRFDAILLDAPCSATGTIRRHPDLPFVKTARDAESLAKIQAQMIDRAVELLAPGGRLVFCTCSLLPMEGEDQFTAALSRHTTLERDQKAVAGWPGIWSARGGGLRIRPDHWADLGGMDGFFIGAMRKTA